MNNIFTDWEKILLRGYSNGSKSYEDAKRSYGANWQFIDHSQIPDYLNKNHWVGGKVPQGLIVLDIDDAKTGQLVYEGLKKAGCSFHAIRTPRGYQFIFQSRADRPLKQNSNMLTLSGIIADYKTGASNCYIVLPTDNTEGREIIHISDRELDPLPLCFYAVRKMKADDVQKDAILDGSRDDTLFRIACSIREQNRIHNLKFTPEERLRALQETNNIFCYPSMSEYEVRQKFESAERYKGEGQEPGVSASVIEEWTEPIPFDDFSKLPDFPIDALPSLGREFVKNVSKVNQVDAGLTAISYLAVISACVAKKAVVDLETHKEPINIFTCSIAEPGERKSGTENILTSPIFQYQDKKQSDMLDEIREAMNAHKIREGRLAKLQKQASHAESPIERKTLEIEASVIAKEIQDNPVPKRPFYILDDVTAEALEIHMAENNERMAIFSTEGGIFQNMAGRYNDKRTCNIDIYLKAHAGDPCSTHRVGRGPQTMLAPALTMGLAVQPDVIKEIGTNQHFRGRGLLARFLYSYCKKQVGYRERQVKSIPESLLNQYREHIFSLMDIPLTTHTFKLSADAQALWNEFYNDIERDMRHGGSLEFLTDWGSKLSGAVARIAGLLHFAEHGERAVDMPISVSIVSASCVIGAYFKEHALATFGFMQADPRIESAKGILDYIQRHKPQTFKGRDVLRHTNFKTIEDVMPALKILTERDFIRELESEYSGMGRPQAKEYQVNQKVFTLRKPLTKVTKVPVIDTSVSFVSESVGNIK